MGSSSNIVDGLSHFGCMQGQQNRNRLGVGLRLGKGEMASGTSQVADAVALLAGFMCTCLPNLIFLF